MGTGRVTGFAVAVVLSLASPALGGRGALANRVDSPGRFVDQNGDGFCNIQDISLAVSSFGQSTPRTWP